VGSFSGILLIIALVIVSGVIAYVGDIVGRRMGRKRLSLFGMRPRHTAIAMSVAAGMLITMMTLTVAMTLSRDVKDGFLRVAEMRRTQRETLAELQELRERLEGLQGERETAEAVLAERQAEVVEARGLLVAAGTDLEAEQAELASASAALDRAEDAFARQAQLVANLTRTEDELRRSVQNLRAMAAGGIAIQRATPILFGAGQPLDVCLIDGRQPVSEIRAELDAFVDYLDAGSRSAGARPGTEGERAVIIRKPVRDPETDALTWVEADQVLEAVAERVHEGAGGVIVRAFSVVNTHSGESVPIDFELFRNHLVFRQGEQLAETITDGRLSQASLMNALVSLLREQVGEQARSRNVMPRLSHGDAHQFGSTRGAVGEIGYEELFEVIGELRAVGGPARVTVRAARDTWTIGPLDVEMAVEPLT